MIAYLNGKFISNESAMVGIHDAGFLFGHGVYETLRTYNGKLKYIVDHFERLRNSASSLQIPVPINKTEFSVALEQMVQKNSAFKGDDLRIRITLTAGDMNFVANTKGQPTLLITAKSIQNLELKPIQMASYKVARTAPEVKSTSMIANILAQQYAHKQKADEALLISNDNYVREGSFCNIFAVRTGQLQTPAKNLLDGITRGIVLHIASKILAVKEQAIHLDDLLNADEVFITSSVRGVVPVAKIDDNTFKAPGTFTKKVRDLYNLKVFGKT